MDNETIRKLEEEGWKKAYKEHWNRVLAAKPAVEDRNTPILDCDEEKTVDCIRDMVARLKDNMAVMMTIASYRFVQGKIDSYRNEKPKSSTSAQDLLIQDIKRLEKDNRKMGRRILRAKATFSTFDNMFLKRRRRKKRPFRIPRTILKKYNLEELNLPWDNHLLRLFLRPRIYLILQVDRTMDISHLEIELYTEAAPQVVYDFIRLCKQQDLHRIKVKRGFINLWLDCEIVLDSTDASMDELEYDEDALANEKQSGILSFPGKYVEGFSHGYLNFSISFRPVYMPKGHRIAFGRVVRGLRALSKLEDFATIKGGLKKTISVAECGILTDISPYTKKCDALNKLQYLNEW